METKVLAPRNPSYRLEFTSQYFKRGDSDFASTSGDTAAASVYSIPRSGRGWKASAFKAKLRLCLASICMFLRRLNKWSRCFPLNKKTASSFKFRNSQQQKKNIQLTLQPPFTFCHFSQHNLLLSVQIFNIKMASVYQLISGNSSNQFRIWNLTQNFALCALNCRRLCCSCRAHFCSKKGRCVALICHFCHNVQKMKAVLRTTSSSYILAPLSPIKLARLAARQAGRQASPLRAEAPLEIKTCAACGLRGGRCDCTNISSIFDWKTKWVSALDASVGDGERREGGDNTGALSPNQTVWGARTCNRACTRTELLSLLCRPYRCSAHEHV